LNLFEPLLMFKILSINTVESKAKYKWIDK